ncbi:hypothetical protein PPYR_11504 [Photinus pyralis]|uniref:Importin-13 n=2 Tax=Photinus pyralis TaxID=7054 RepID=A0A1Y1LWR6_PHOPY|nr:importin-13 isoform X1 [Photinus pyralis]KAB0794665.1 hypothetical protein PPYR_11504 [Photinus pyralis]
MDYSVENLERAVTLFYKTEAGQQAEAHRWLTEAQNSPQAWSFVWELLDLRRSSEVQFFAATTLHTKLMKCWSEVPVDHYELLKNRILESIVNYAMGPKLILNRLCITLSAYIIHTVPLHWPNAFEELVSSFQPRHLPNVEPERVIWMLLEILSVIPEEFQSTTLAVSQKNRVRSVLYDVSKDILKVIEMCLLPVTGGGYSIANLTTYLNSTRCASTWIQLGGITIEQGSHIMNLLVDLTCYVYWNRQEAECLSSEELELTETAIEALSSIMLQPQTLKFNTYVLKHTRNILEKFGKILQTESLTGDSNKDIIANIYGLIITIADTHAKLLISYLKSANPEEQQLTTDILACILGCSNLRGIYPVDESSSSLPFGFWYTLQDDILSLDSAECAELLRIVKPYYRQLVCILLRKSMYPNIWEDPPNVCWSLDDKEMFRCYRQDVADTFMYCYNVLNLEMLDILQSKLLEALVECHKFSMNWNAVESCLHAFAAVSECIEWETLYLPKLMSTIKDIPYDDLHIKVLATALDTVGAYSEWIADHPQVLDNVIPLITSGLGNTEVAPNATLALKDISRNCQNELVSYADHLLAVCQCVLQTGQLRLAERTRLMHSVGIILSIMPINKIMECLNAIVGSFIQEIEALLNSQTSTGVGISLTTRLKMLSALFATLHVKQKNVSTDASTIKQPILLVVQNTLPLYLRISRTYYANTELMEVLCELLKHVITTLMNDSKTLLPSILELLVSTYSLAPQASILLLSKTILVMFGIDEDVICLLHQLLYELIRQTLEMCAELNCHNQLSEKGDVVESFFSMLTHVSKRNSRLIFNSNLDCVAMFQCAVLCLGLPEVQTLKACTAFLVNFISLSRENDQAHVIQKCGDGLVNRILINLGGTVPRSAADILSDILLILNKKYCDNLCRWLNIQLAQDGFPTPLITSNQKENFIKLVLREKANKRKLSESVTEFTLLCRGIIKADIS